MAAGGTLTAGVGRNSSLVSTGDVRIATESPPKSSSVESNRSSWDSAESKLQDPTLSGKSSDTAQS